MMRVKPQTRKTRNHTIPHSTSFNKNAVPLTSKEQLNHVATRKNLFKRYYRDYPEYTRVP